LGLGGVEDAFRGGLHGAFVVRSHHVTSPSFPSFWLARLTTVSLCSSRSNAQAWEGTMADSADMHDEATRRILDGRSWADFCDALKAAGAIVLDPANPADPRNRAEGFRYLGRLARAALETFVEDADPMAPELLRTCHA